MKVKDHLFTKRSLSQFKGGGLGAYVGRVCLTKPVVFTLGHNLLKVGGGEQLVLQLICVIVLKPLRKPSQPKGMMLQRWVWVMHPFSQSVFTKAYKVLTLQYMLRSACESQFPSYKWFKILNCKKEYRLKGFSVSSWANYLSCLCLNSLAYKWE